MLDSTGHLKQLPDASAPSGDAPLRALAHGANSALPASTLAAYRHLRRGEILLARDEQPEIARSEFAAAARLAVGSGLAARAVRETAAYDTGLALFYAGRYQPAAEHLQHLLASHTALFSISRRDASLFLRHARACAGYHAERSKAGITEPLHIEPLCGIEAIAAWQRAHGRKYDKATLLPTCRVTGEGSSLKDLEDAADRLKLSHVVLTADEEGLKALPKPLVAFVEHDHFIAITAADASGVTYLCSDCGVWPGGQRHVTWKQWRMMEGGPYMALAVPGSDTAKALARASEAPERVSGVGDRVSDDSISRHLTTPSTRSDTHLSLRTDGFTTPDAVNPIPLSSAVLTTPDTRHPTAFSLRLTGFGGQSLGAAARIAARLKGHVLRYVPFTAQVKCGNKPQGNECPSPVCCPRDSGGARVRGSAGGQRTLTAAPSAGDPVNLATGEEEYRPGADLSVYNPIGPSVTIERQYNSLRAAADQYNADDFGMGWSHNYNYAIYDATVRPLVRYQQGTTVTTVIISGSDAPQSGLNWDIVQNGTTIATSTTPNGWSAGGNPYYISLTIPANAPVGTNYEVRTKVSGATGFKSSFFDVYASTTLGQVPQGGSATFSFTGSEAPGSGLTWDVLQGSTTIATSAAPNGWSAGPNMAGAPPLAPLGTYKVRYRVNSYSTTSSSFQVYAVDYNPKAGTRYLVEPNGAQVAISAPSVPTAANPSVSCSLPAGYPLLVTWNYVAGYTCGSYTITSADRTRMVTTTVAKSVGTGLAATAILMVIGQIVDRNGNAINFNYGGAGSGKFPMLSTISDSNGSALVTFTRATDGTGNMTAINDRYGRTVAYHLSAYATANVPSGYTQSFQELDHVSRIVATGTANPPDRYAYGYQNVSNGENTEAVPFLHTITVPSPTGTGNATATINYATNGTCAVTSLVDANGNSRNYSATDQTHTLVTVKNAAGATVYSYTSNFDANMNSAGYTNGAGVYQHLATYGDANDPYRPSQVVNANGNTSSYYWDAFGNCTSAVSPRNVTTNYSYSYANFALGELTQVQQGSKTASAYTYFEPSGLVASTSTPTPGTAGSGQTVTTAFSYDTLGNVLTIVSPGNNASQTVTTTLSYSSDGTYSQNAAIGQPLAVTDNLGHKAHYRYDSQGRLVSVADALGNETDTAFNLTGQVAQITYPATGQTGTGRGIVQTGYLYTGGPQVTTKVLDESGTTVRQVASSYGPEMELLSTTGVSESAQYAYDALYRKTSITDGNSNQTLCAFDNQGYLSSITHPGGTGTYQFTSYDSLGNLLQRIDGRGVVTNYLYNDVESRLTDIQYPASTALNVHVHYDIYSRLDSISDGSGARTVSYDDNNKTLTTTTTYTGLSAQVVSNQYYSNGALSSISTPAGSFNYTYDGVGRLTGVTNPFGETFGWKYLDNNWLWKQTSGSVLTATITYNSVGEILELANCKQDANRTLLSDFAGMTYDGVRNRLTTTANIPTYAQGTLNASYQYDGISRLTQENNASYAYDGAGNLTSNRGLNFNYNAGNQISTAVTDHNQTAQYDLNGNETSVLAITASGWGNIACSYDAENHLTAFGSSFTAGYGADGLRTWKQTAAGRTYFLYGGGLIPLCELDSSGNVIAVNTAGAYGLVGRHTSSGSVFYAFDARGNTANRLDSSGNILNSSTYTGFGSQSSNVASSDPYDGFGAQYGTSKEVGAATISLCGLRYYSPDQARWLNRDPTWYQGGLNLYSYTSDNPVTHVDPAGKLGEEVAIGFCLADPPCAAAVAIGAGIYIACLITRCWCLFISCDSAPARPIEFCYPIEADPPTEADPPNYPQYPPGVQAYCWALYVACLNSGTRVDECFLEYRKCVLYTEEVPYI